MKDTEKLTSFMNLFAAIAMALLHRERTGQGSEVSTSLHASGLWSNGMLAQGALLGAYRYEAYKTKASDDDARLGAVTVLSAFGRQSTVVDAVEQAGVRAVLVTGFGGLKGAQLPASMHAVPTVPYDWLLPRVSALVHHGGAGSTALALKAGIPSVTIYFGFDQKLWGDRVHALGAGPAPISAERLVPHLMRFAVRSAAAADTTR